MELLQGLDGCGGGGNCVKIKHNSTYQTIYAHMQSFGRGIKEGLRVKQGQNNWLCWIDRKINRSSPCIMK